MVDKANTSRYTGIMTTLPETNTIYVVVQTSVAYNDGYSVPTSQEKYYTDRAKAVEAAAELNLNELFDRGMLTPFPNTDTFQAYRDKISWEYETAEEAQEILDDEIAVGLHFLSKLPVAELKAQVAELDINARTRYGYEGDWYGVTALKLASD